MNVEQKCYVLLLLTVSRNKMVAEFSFVEAWKKFVGSQPP